MPIPLCVLLVEDSEDDAELLALEFKRAGYIPTIKRVDTAEDMHQELSKDVAGQAAWDIIISDYAMPHFNGMDALALYNESGLDIPFILLSGAIGEDIAVNAMVHGAHDYILKDRMTRLIPAIERELREARLRCEKREAEEALRQSEERLKLVLEGSNVGFWDWNIVTGAVQFSQRWAEMLGYNLAEIEPHVRTWEKLIHPDDMEARRKALKDHLEERAPFYEYEYRLLTKSGNWKWVLDRGKVVRRVANSQPVRAAGTQIDITERKQSEEKFNYLGTHDALTGLFNRTFFETELERMQHSRMYPVSIVVVDVDGLKKVNDSQGHAAGDELLKRTAQVLRVVFRTEDVVARIGGDEFAILLPKSTHSHALEALARIRSSLKTYNDHNPNLSLSLSLGVATGTRGDGLTKVMKEADEAMYQEKSEKKRAC